MQRLWNMKHSSCSDATRRFSVAGVLVQLTRRGRPSEVSLPALGPAWVYRSVLTRRLGMTTSTPQRLALLQAASVSDL